MGVSTMTRKAVVTSLAAVALGVSVFVASSAMADNSGRCDKNTACNDEIFDACGPNSNGTSCAKDITNQCKEHLCTCTGEEGLPRCPVGATTTTSSTTTSSTTTSSTTSTTTTSTTTSSTTSTTSSTTTTSSTPSTTSSTTTTSTSSTTTTTEAPIQCCKQSSPMGAF